MAERAIFSTLRRRKSKRDTPRIILKSGFMVIDEYGVARPDYADPELQKRLREQVKKFAAIKVHA